MTSYKKFKFLNIYTEGHISTIKINHPKALNALNTKIFHEFNRALTMVENDKNNRVLIITGVDKSFVAGADISEMVNLNQEQAKAFGEFGSEVFRRIELLHIPVIASINGFALGGGCELALCCDIRIASQNAKFGLPEVGLGITPGFSATQRLPRLVGTGKAKELIYTGSIIDAQEALNIGLVNKLTTREELEEETLIMAQKIAEQAPIAVQCAKKAINSGMDTDIESGIEIETNHFAHCFTTKDQKNGMQAFLKREKTTFEGK